MYPSYHRVAVLAPVTERWGLPGRGHILLPSHLSDREGTLSSGELSKLKEGWEACAGGRRGKAELAPEARRASCCPCCPQRRGSVCPAEGSPTRLTTR